MFALLLLLSLFGNDSVEPSESIYAQMRAANVEIKTLQFEFRCTESSINRTTKPETTREKHFTGNAWFSDPNFLRIEYTEGVGLKFDSTPSGEIKSAVSDNSVSRILTTNRKTGFANGTVTEGVTTFNLVPGLAEFWPRCLWDFEDRFLQFDKISVSQVGDLVRLSGRGTQDTRRIEWDIDPAKGFCYVRKKENHEHPFGRSVRTDLYELFEPKPGIWLPRRTVTEYQMTGQFSTSTQTIAELIPDSVKVNEALPAKIFELPFPNGADVMNTNQKTSYIEGGGTSRSRESVAKLANEAKQFDSAQSAPDPIAAVPSIGALTSDSSSRSTMLLVCGASLVILVGGAFGVRRWRSRQ